MLVSAAPVAAQDWGVQPIIPPQPAVPYGQPGPLLVPISPAAAPLVVPPPVPPPMAPPPPPPRMDPLPPPVSRAAVPTGRAAAGRPEPRGVYTVQKGARLFVIAHRTKTSLVDLIALNPTLEIDRMLPAGTKVVLPIPGSW